MQKTESNLVKNNYKPIFVYDEMKTSYLSYAMSVIVSRALPDVRDGLKPVHRRIIYAMYKGGFDWSKQYRKSARVVGDVIGKYHPHGDQAVYDALVRLTQNFSMSLPLIDGQGNFGSIDGDPPAAMRYTETKLAKVSQFLIDDIEKINFIRDAIKNELSLPSKKTLLNICFFQIKVSIVTSKYIFTFFTYYIFLIISKFFNEFTTNRWPR